MGAPHPPPATEDQMDAAVALLRDTSSSARPLHAETIAAALRIEDGPSFPIVRHIIAECIRHQVAPIGSDERGFYLIRTGDELPVAVQGLKERRNALDARIDSLQRVFHGEVPVKGPIRWEPDPEESGCGGL